MFVASPNSDNNCISLVLAHLVDNIPLSGRMLLVRSSLKLDFCKYGQTAMPLKKIMYKGLNMYGQGVQQFETMAQKELEKLIKNVTDQRGNDFNPKKFLSNYMANLVAILLAGSVVDETEAEVIWKYSNAIRESVEVATDTVLWTFPLLRIFPVEVGRRYRRTMEAKEELLKIFFHSHKETYVTGRERGLVDVLFKLQLQEKRDGETICLNDSHIQAIIQDIIFGGLGSITYGILSILLVLLHHHEYVDGIYQEIIKVVGLDRYPSLEDRPAMPYTEAVILEALRYVTPVPTTPRCAIKDVEFEGYTIPKEATIMINIWTIHHDPAIWGDPWIFRPERFLYKNGELLPAEHALR